MTDYTTATAAEDQQWAEKLTAEEFAVLRRGGTEAPGTGVYTNHEAVGVYACRACGSELFRSSTKFHSGCGWPAFYSPLAGDAIVEKPDLSIPGRPRTEVLCAACGSHLGHVFHGEGFDTPTDARYCINSICLTFADDSSGDAP